MKGRVVVLDHIDGCEAAALMVDGRIDDLLVDPPTARPAGPGAILRAIADRPVKGMGGMFMRLAGGEHGFLRQGRGIAPGQALNVQVTGLAEPGKAVPLTTRIIHKSRYAIVTPDAPGINAARSIRDEEARDRLLELAHAGFDLPGGGLILRTAAAFAPPEAVEEDIALMSDEARHVAAAAGTEPAVLCPGPGAHLLAWREWADPFPDAIVDENGAFEREGVLDAIEALRGPREELGGGATLYVEPTRALVAVDVNTGADASPAAALKANIAAARALPRALRLRGLGGQITVDFAPLAKKDQRQLEQVLKAAFRSDPVDTALAGWTPLGHFELQRKRERLPLAEVLPR